MAGVEDFAAGTPHLLLMFQCMFAGKFEQVLGWIYCNENSTLCKSRFLEEQVPNFACPRIPHRVDNKMYFGLT